MEYIFCGICFDFRQRYGADFILAFAGRQTAAISAAPKTKVMATRAM